MSGRHNFDEPTGKFPPKRNLRLGARKARPRRAMALHELRRARAMTQKAVGEALGGRLSIVAEFPQGSVVITNFSDAGEDGAPK